MREIKFRAWDKKRKEMFPVHELEWHKIIHSLTTCIGYDDPDKDGWTMHGGRNNSYANGERYVLLQYTELKDKNGVDIYEGDILSTDLDRPFNVVVFRNGAFMFQCHDNEKDYYDYVFSADEESDRWKYGEIIGNIYENPELLERR